MSEIVLFTKDVVGRRMAGPGIRAFHLARELRSVAETTLIGLPDDSLDGIDVVDVRSGMARELVKRATVVIGQPSRQLFSMLRGSRARTILDLFDPTVRELDELLRGRLAPRLRLHRVMETRRLRKALASGDFFMCATPHQQEYYERLAHDWGLTPPSQWLVVPFGVDDAPLPAAVSRDPVPLFVWNGGRWPWLDADLAERSVRELNAEGAHCRLLILGGRRPNEGIDQSRLTKDPAVEVNDEWVPYRERGRWLRRAMAAVMLHRRTAEAEVSIRTRFFDALWASLPVIASRGGWVSELVEREGLGVVVEPESAAEVRGAMRKLIEDDAFRLAAVFNLERVRSEFLWSRVAAPLVDAARQLTDR